MVQKDFSIPSNKVKMSSSDMLLLSLLEMTAYVRSRIVEFRCRVMHRFAAGFW